MTRRALWVGAAVAMSALALTFAVFYVVVIGPLYLGHRARLLLS